MSLLYGDCCISPRTPRACMSTVLYSLERSSSCAATISGRGFRGTFTSTIGSLPLVLAARFAGLVDGDLRERRKRGAQPIPDPRRQILGRGVLEPLHLVQIVVIQLSAKRLDQPLDLPVIQEPPRRWIDLALHGHFHAEGMPVEAAALVPFRRLGKQVRRLEGEIPGQSNLHARLPGLIAGDSIAALNAARWSCGSGESGEPPDIAPRATTRRFAARRRARARAGARSRPRSEARPGAGPRPPHPLPSAART